MTAISEDIFTTTERYLINLYFSGSRMSTAIAICAAMPDITESDVYAAADSAVIKLSAIGGAEFKEQFPGVVDYGR